MRIIEKPGEIPMENTKSMNEDSQRFDQRRLHTRDRTGTTSISRETRKTGGEREERESNLRALP